MRGQVSEEKERYSQSATTNLDDVKRELNCSFELIWTMDDIVVGRSGMVVVVVVGGWSWS